MTNYDDGWNEGYEAGYEAGREDLLYSSEADICKVRGHQPSDVVLTSNPPMNRCRWCSVAYRHNTVLFEQGSTYAVVMNP